MRPFPLKMAVSYSYKQNKPLLRRKFSMRKNQTEVVFILDRSGSMSGLEKDTIGGFNSMIEKQKREAGQALISTVLFNNNSKVLYDRVEVQKIPSMTEDDYSVYGCTALLDADRRCYPSHWKCPQICAHGRCTGAYRFYHHDRWYGKCKPYVQQ